MKAVLKGDIFKKHSDKLGLLWTNDQWQTVINAMEEYSNQELTQSQSDIDELVEALIHAGLGNIERIDFDNYNLLIQKHTKK